MRYHRFGLNEFISYMKDYNKQEVRIEEVGHDSVVLEHDEVDSDLIPDDIKDIVPDPTLYNIFTYSNDKEWIVAVSVEATTYRPLFLVCTMDGEMVHIYLNPIDIINSYLLVFICTKLLGVLLCLMSLQIAVGSMSYSLI